MHERFSNIGARARAAPKVYAYGHMQCHACPITVVVIVVILTVDIIIIVTTIIT